MIVLVVIVIPSDIYIHGHSRVICYMRCSVFLPPGAQSMGRAVPPRDVSHNCALEVDRILQPCSCRHSSGRRMYLYLCNLQCVWSQSMSRAGKARFVLLSIVARVAVSFNIASTSRQFEECIVTPRIFCNAPHFSPNSGSTASDTDAVAGVARDEGDCQKGEIYH